MTKNNELYHRPRIFIGLTLINPKKKEEGSGIFPCLLHMPTRALFPMNSIDEAVSAARQLCSCHQVRLPEGYTVEDVNVEEIDNARLIQTEPPEEFDELIFSEGDFQEDLFDCLVKSLILKQRPDVDDCFNEEASSDENETEFLEKALLKMENQEQAGVIREIFKKYPVDKGAIGGRRVEIDSVLTVTYLDFSEIKEALRQADPAFQNPMFGERDFTYSLEDVSPEIIERYQLKEGHALIAQVGAMINGMDNMFRKNSACCQRLINQCYQDDALDFQEYAFMKGSPKSETELAAELAKEKTKGI